MTLDALKPSKGSRQKKCIIGRGWGSGNGKTSGYGHKGAKARSGRGKGYGSGFEGGQTRLYRRLPKIRGWRNEIIHPVKIAEIRIEKLNVIPTGTEVTLDVLRSYDLARMTDQAYKVLGGGELSVALNFKKALATTGAVESIKKVGGTIEFANEKQGE